MIRVRLSAYLTTKSACRWKDSLANELRLTRFLTSGFEDLSPSTLMNVAVLQDPDVFRGAVS